MEVITGFGGLFFSRARFAAARPLVQEHLGFRAVAAGDEEPPWQQEGGPSVFAAFEENTA
jgi:hypothetical protein